MIPISVIGWLAVGAGLGSVANAVIYRLPRGVSWIKGRSKCPKCDHKLGIWDLIPVVSYLCLGGKCRYCRSPIPYRYLAVEVVMAAGFLLISNFQFPIFKILVLQAILWATVVIAAIDWETKLVPETLVVVWGILVIIYNLQFAINFQFWGMAVAVGLIGGAWAVSRGRAMGFGDVEIAAVMGWWLGWPKIAAGLWTAFVSGAVYGVWLLARKKAGMKSQVAFGPFLIIGAWAGQMWGEKLWRLVLP